MATADTKERILRAAESLFARDGFAATSLRNVIASAEVNLAAVHYHFGSKQELVRAVFAWRFDPINQERLRLLSQLETRAGARRASLEQILECLILPILRAARDQSGGWSMVGALVGRVHTEPDVAVRRIFYDQFEEVGERFFGALAAALPDLPTDELWYRFHFAIAAMAASLVNPEEVRLLSKGRLDPTADPERFVRRWITFVTAGLKTAPTLPDEAVAAARRKTARVQPRTGKQRAAARVPKVARSPRGKRK